MGILPMSFPLPFCCSADEDTEEETKHGHVVRATHGQHAHATIYCLAFVSYFDMS
jgi:hypothetical protein